MARMEKQRDKAAKRLERKQARLSGVDPDAPVEGADEELSKDEEEPSKDEPAGPE